jgi:hypothetical protein
MSEQGWQAFLTATGVDDSISSKISTGLVSEQSSPSMKRASCW